MFTEKVSINYRGFHPSIQTKEIVGALLEEILLEGPSFSKLKAQFAVEGEFAHVVYKGIIEIQSGAGLFFVKAESSQIADLAHKLLKRSRRQFSKWKDRKIGGKARAHHHDDLETSEAI